MIPKFAVHASVQHNLCNTTLVNMYISAALYIYNKHINS